MLQLLLDSSIKDWILISDESPYIFHLPLQNCLRDVAFKKYKQKCELPESIVTIIVAGKVFETCTKVIHIASNSPVHSNDAINYAYAVAICLF